MLVLSRHINETILIGGEEVRVTILAVRGDKVRIGIQAPRHVIVHREEVFERIKRDGPDNRKRT